ncbi:MAG: hypothetical protein HQL63_13375 [Magnetococcales bacterium]|nr:hypothetical protein [Magnetococcales bacterium]
MAPFERIYGGVIDQFKRENDSPFISAYVAERQGRAMGASGDMSSHALGGGSEEPAAGQPSRGDGGCPGGQKIGAGGACQPYSVWGLYAENSGSGDGRKKLTAPKKKIGPPPPIPAYKKEYFKSKEKQEEWRRFHEEVNQLPGVTPVEVKTYMEMFAAEGGMAKAPGGSAFGGVKQDTLDGMIQGGYVTNIPPGTKTTELTISQMAEAYRGYFDQTFRAIGRHEVLNQIGNETTTVVVADTIFRHGSRGGSEILQDAINKVPGRKTESDGVLGSETLNTIKDIAKDPVDNKVFLKKIVDFRNVNVYGWKEKKLPTGDVIKTPKKGPESERFDHMSGF